MDRRQFLALAGTSAVATTPGCHAGYHAYLSRRIEITDKSAEGFSFEATVERPQISRLRTARIRATFTNPSEEAIEFPLLWGVPDDDRTRHPVTSKPVYGRVASENRARDREPTLILKPIDLGPVRCHQIDDGYFPVYLGLTLAPGESVDVPYWCYTNAAI